MHTVCPVAMSWLRHHLAQRDLVLAFQTNARCSHKQRAYWARRKASKWERRYTPRRMPRHWGALEWSNGFGY